MKKILALVCAALLVATAASAQSVFQATVPEAAPTTTDISTDELRRVLGDGSATVFDARPMREFAISHIPGALNVSARPGMPAHLYVSDVAEIDRLLNGDRSRPLILYCNGPTCGKSRRLAAELLGAATRTCGAISLAPPAGGCSAAPCKRFWRRCRISPPTGQRCGSMHGIRKLSQRAPLEARETFRGAALAPDANKA